MWALLILSQQFALVFVIDNNLFWFISILVQMTSFRCYPQILVHSHSLFDFFSIQLIELLIFFLFRWAFHIIALINSFDNENLEFMFSWGNTNTKIKCTESFSLNETCLIWSLKFHTNFMCCVFDTWKKGKEYFWKSEAFTKNRTQSYLLKRFWFYF